MELPYCMAGLECDSGAALLHDSQVWNVSEQIRKNVEAAEMSREASIAITVPE